MLIITRYFAVCYVDNLRISIHFVAEEILEILSSFPRSLSWWIHLQFRSACVLQALGKDCQAILDGRVL